MSALQTSAPDALDAPWVGFYARSWALLAIGKRIDAALFVEVYDALFALVTPGHCSLMEREPASVTICEDGPLLLRGATSSR
ncbi:hypothetical protein [Dactylosporangium sp. NPDC051484]|uniref:hypothetical protein n=1 Tax=Dactylosporangium sp. NPDC051484 TaxID=3154942 RepID=UPI00344B6A9A